MLVVLAPGPEVVARREAPRTKVAYRDDAAAIRRSTPPSARRPADRTVDRHVNPASDEIVDEIIRRGSTDGRLD